MARQTRLTPEQVDKFYAEYKIMKEKKFAGDVLDKTVWKNQLELYMSEELSGNTNWSNTDIRKANRRLIRQASWSDRQVATFTKNILSGENEEVRRDLMNEFGITSDKVFARFVKEQQGSIYQFLKGYAGDWNQYFNS